MFTKAKNLKKTYNREKVMRVLKRVFAVLLAVLCIPFVGNLTTENKKVQAVGIPSEEPVFYYFCDAMPMVLLEELSQPSDGRPVIYDVKHDVPDDQLEQYVNTSYLTGFAEGSIVILDLQRISIEPPTLEIVFRNLKNQGCTTVLIAKHHIADFFVTTYNDVVDHCIGIGFNRLERFIELCVLHYQSKVNSGMNGVFLTDRRFYGNNTIAYENLSSIMQTSLFFRYLIKSLNVNLEDCSDYSNLKAVMAYQGNDDYVNLFSQGSNVYTFGSYWDVKTTESFATGCAFVYSSFDPDQYLNLKSISDDQIVNYPNEPFPVYPLIVEPVEEDPDGLAIVTLETVCRDLRIDYNEPEQVAEMINGLV